MRKRDEERRQKRILKSLRRWKPLPPLDEERKSKVRKKYSKRFRFQKLKVTPIPGKDGKEYTLPIVDEIRTGLRRGVKSKWQFLVTDGPEDEKDRIPILTAPQYLYANGEWWITRITLKRQTISREWIAVKLYDSFTWNRVRIETRRESGMELVGTDPTFTGLSYRIQWPMIDADTLRGMKAKLRWIRESESDTINVDGYSIIGGLIRSQTGTVENRLIASVQTQWLKARPQDGRIEIGAPAKARIGTITVLSQWERGMKLSMGRVKPPARIHWKAVKEQISILSEKMMMREIRYTIKIETSLAGRKGVDR